MAMLDELLVGLGFEYDPEGMSEFQQDLDNTIGSIKKLASIAAAGAAAITGLVTVTTAASDEQGKFAAEIGESVGMIDALGFASKRSGGSIDGVNNSLRQLSIRAAEAARGVGSGIEAFGLLDLSVLDSNDNLKSTSELLIEISKQFQGLDTARQIELADKLGVRDSIRLLQQGPQAIRELIEEAEALGVTTAKDAVVSADFQDSLTDLWQITKQVSRTFTRELAPILEESNDKMTEWWKNNRRLIEQNLPKWIDTVTQGLKILSIILAGMLSLKIIGLFTSFISLLKTTTVSLLAMNAAAALLPILIAGGIAALLLLIEDAKVFFEGGESFIGDMIEKFPQWNSELQATANVFNTIWEITKLVLDGWSMIFDLFKGKLKLDFDIGNFSNFLTDIIGIGPQSRQERKQLIEEKQRRGEDLTLGEKFLQGFDSLIDGGNKVLEKASVESREVVNNVTEIFSNENTVTNLKETVREVSESPVFVTLPDSQSILEVPNQTNSKTTTFKIDKLEIPVNGVNDPKLVANEVMNVFQQAAQDLDTVVDQ